MTSRANSAFRPWLLWVAWATLCAFFFSKSLVALCQYALHNANVSYIILIPFLVSGLLFLDREKIHHTSFDLQTASVVALPATVLVVLAWRSAWSDSSLILASLILAFVLFLIAGFVAIFASRSAKAAWFPLAFLAFLIPFPESLLNRFIYILQAGSAAVAEWIFDWTRIPVLRDGFVFRLPRISIEVAKECSGINSSMALLILALLVAHVSFTPFWKKAVFVFAGLLMMVVKNGVRIATLTILANYVNPEFLYGRLHHQGGIVFFLIGLALLWPVYWFLRRGEERPIGGEAKTV